MISSLITAVRTLTILPVPGKDAKNFSTSLFFFPIVGAILALCIYPFFHAQCLVPLSLKPLMTLCVVIIPLLLSGALHYDGLADWADGFFGGRNKEKIREIMKDSRIGTFGVCALLIDFFLKYTIVGALNESGFFFVASGIILARVMQAAACATMPYAFGDKGVAAPFVQGAKSKRLVATSLILVATALYFWHGWLPTLQVICTALMCTIFFLMYCNKRIGGISGDCLGALNEFVEITVLLCGVIAGLFI